MNDLGASSSSTTTTTTTNKSKSKSTTKMDSPSETNNKSSGGGWNPSSFVGGASAGLVASATLQPFEVIKTRMQVPGGQGGANNIFSTASRVGENARGFSSVERSVRIVHTNDRRGWLIFLRFGQDAKRGEAVAKEEICERREETIGI